MLKYENQHIIEADVKWQNRFGCSVDFTNMLYGWCAALVQHLMFRHIPAASVCGEAQLWLTSRCSRSAAAETGRAAAFQTGKYWIEINFKYPLLCSVWLQILQTFCKNYLKNFFQDKQQTLQVNQIYHNKKLKDWISFHWKINRCS